jgi:hypothetical protein
VIGPPEWAPILKNKFNNTDPSFTLKYYNTQLVSDGGAHDARLGPHAFPKSRGPLSNAVQKFMRDGVPELWPDWESGQISQVCPLPMLWLLDLE